MADYDGPSSTVPTFQKFLAAGVPLAVSPQFNLEAAIARALADDDPPISCKLSSHWDFDSIVQNSRFGSGHVFTGTALVSLPDQISRVIDDLQRAFRKRHPSASAEAECCFLESWDVLRHTAEFCGKKLAPSPEAVDFVGPMRANEVPKLIESATTAGPSQDAGSRFIVGRF
jgi:hypothetical protein